MDEPMVSGINGVAEDYVWPKDNTSDFTIYGYTCWACGCWIPNGTVHICPSVPVGGQDPGLYPSYLPNPDEKCYLRYCPHCGKELK